MTDLATIPEQRTDGQLMRTDPAAYPSWPLQARMTYARFLSDAADLIPRGLWAQAEPGQPARPSAAKIFLVLETGAMLDLHPMAAMQGIDVIEGKATISPQLMTTLIRRAGHLFRIKKTGSVTAGDYAVTVQYARAEDREWVSEETWDLHRAVRAQLIKLEQRNGIYSVVAQSSGGKALPWQLYPESLCVWRCIGVVGRENFDDVLKGIGYMPEELEVLVSPDGVRELPAREEEDAYIERIEALDDKADLAAIFHEINRAERWSDRIRAVFDATLAKATKDSRPPKAGAPGHTGEPSIDQPPADVAAAEQALADDEQASHEAEEQQVAEQQHREEQVDVATQPVDVIEPEVVDEDAAAAEAQAGPGEILEVREREEAEAPTVDEEAAYLERSRREFEEWQRQQEAGE